MIQGQTEYESHLPLNIWNDRIRVTFICTIKS